MSSFCRTIDAAIRHKVNAVAMFGLASEYYKLTDQERTQSTIVLIEQVAARIPVIISVVAHSTEVAVKDAKRAEQEGADALMVLPPFFLAPNADSVRRHICEIASAVSLPLIVQYAPTETGYQVEAQAFAQLQQEAPNIARIKVDRVPAGAMIQELRALGVDSLVGYMGIHLPSDYACGVSGVMPTVSLCPAFVEIWDNLVAGKSRALVLHESLLPVLKFMMKSVECLIASEKQLLQQRGVIRTKYCRNPSYHLNPKEQAEFAIYATHLAPWLVGGTEEI